MSGWGKMGKATVRARARVCVYVCVCVRGGGHGNKERHPSVSDKQWVVNSTVAEAQESLQEKH